MNKVIAFLITLLMTTPLSAEDWPEWRGLNRDGVWNETGIVPSYTQLKPKWRVKISSGYSGPTIADGRVYVSDRVVSPKQIERVLCFDDYERYNLDDFDPEVFSVGIRYRF